MDFIKLLAIFACVLQLTTCFSFVPDTNKHSLALSMSQPKSDNKIVRQSIARSISTGIAFGGTLFSLSVVSSNAADDIADTQIQYDKKGAPLRDYLGKKVTLIVNVASQCALTSQYEELVELYNKYHDKGFNILAFPCNQFGSQEPAPVEKIRADMKRQFGVEFPIFDKIEVNGPTAHPLYVQLKSYKDIGVSNIAKISWNFEKFILDSEGKPLRRYKPGILPTELSGDIESLLTKGVIPPKKKATLNSY